MNYPNERWEDEKEEETETTIKENIVNSPFFIWSIVSSIICVILLSIVLSQKEGEARILQEAYKIGEVKNIAVTHTGSTTNINISILNTSENETKKAK